MVSKPAKPPAKKERLARVLPGDLRSERLVVRIHPDLMGILVQRSRELGLNRSTFVEKILIGWAVQSEGADLDGIGKHVPPRMSHDQPAPGSGPMKTMAQAFGFNSGRQPLAYKAALQKDDEEE